jgi:DNA-binding SARP family transcriptional activator
VLGALEAEHDSRRIAVGRRRERCLLGLLLLAAGQTVPIDRLVDLLWEEPRPATARTSLYTHMSRLRGCLDPGGDGRFGLRLVHANGGYVAHVDKESVDAHEFRLLIDRAARLAEPADQVPVLRRALSLWRGPILADVASERLRYRVGAELTELRTNAAEALFEAELECGRHRSIVGELTSWVVEYPYRERLVGMLMLAMYRSGRHPDALGVYEQLRDRLHDTLGLDPGPDLRRLHALILRHEVDPPITRYAGQSGHSHRQRFCPDGCRLRLLCSSVGLPNWPR